MSTVLLELDWVSERAACNTRHVFDELCAGIQKDVEAMNAVLIQRHEQRQFVATVASSNNTITVSQRGKSFGTVVQIGIAISGDAIEARNGTAWQAQVCLSNAGRCILKLEDGAELERWQFRKKALAGLFFGD